MAANTAMVRQNWEIGRLIVEEEQGGRRKAEYGKAQIAGLTQRLTTEYGNGYDERNLRYMRSFYLAFPICHTLCDELSWSHYRILMRVTEAQKELFRLQRQESETTGKLTTGKGA